MTYKPNQPKRTGRLCLGFHIPSSIHRNITSYTFLTDKNVLPLSNQSSFIKLVAASGYSLYMPWICYITWFSREHFFSNITRTKGFQPHLPLFHSLSHSSCNSVVLWLVSFTGIGPQKEKGKKGWSEIPISLFLHRSSEGRQCNESRWTIMSTSHFWSPIQSSYQWPVGAAAVCTWPLPAA